MTSRPCLECQKLFTSKRGMGEFCGSSCKRVFHNRRAKRGAMLYDATMLMRDNLAKTEDWPERIALLLATWAAEDVKAGRKRTTKRLYDVGYTLPRTDVVRSYV